MKNLQIIPKFLYQLKKLTTFKLYLKRTLLGTNFFNDLIRALKNHTSITDFLLQMREGQVFMNKDEFVNEKQL